MKPIRRSAVRIACGAFVLLSALAFGCSTSAAPGEEIGEGASMASATPPLLSPDYRQQTLTVERPLVLEYSFGGAATNKVRLNVVNYPAMESDLFFFHMHVDEVASKKAG